MWKGSVSFGLVSIPVRLYVATDAKGVSFHQLCAEHNSRIRYKRWCEQGDHEVAYGDIKKGYEVGRDTYVIIDEDELDNLPLPTARTIEIEEFVPAGSIEPGLYYKGAYYMEPEEAGRKPYHLLKQALEETRRLAVAKIALRDREHLAALHPMDGMMLLNTLHWPDEIRSSADLPGLQADGVKINPRELQMAKSLIDNLAEETFDPDRYHDDYREALHAIVQAKLEGHEAVEAPAVEAEPKVMDLMEALKASVEAARKERTGKTAEKAAPKKERTARRKAS
jgi:DNA end-binding protein Ku